MDFRDLPDTAEAYRREALIELHWSRPQSLDPYPTITQMDRHVARAHVLALLALSVEVASDHAVPLGETPPVHVGQPPQDRPQMDQEVRVQTPPQGQEDHPSTP